MVDWQLWEQVGLTIDIIGGALFLVLGIGTVLVRPQTPASRAFALFAIPFGIDHIVRNVYYMTDTLLGVFHYVNGALWGIAAIGLMWLMVEFPSRSASRRWQWGAFGSIAVLVLLHWGFLTVFIWDAFSTNFAANEGLPPVATAASQFGNALFTVTGHVFLWVMAWKYGRSPRQRRSLVVLSLALGPYFMLSSVVLVEYAIYAGSAGARIGWMIGALPGLVTPILWLVNCAKAPDAATSKSTRNVALILLGVSLVGALLFALAPADVPWSNLGLFGLARITGVAALAYLIVRHRLFDLDVKLKVGISRGAVASVFFAVFLVIGVVAENFLTDRYGWAIGGGAAGLLLFAISPLQSFGQRVADSALPNAKPLAERTKKDRESLFVQMVQEAWADGVLSKAERRVLEVARTRLGVSLERAHQIESRFSG